MKAAASPFDIETIIDRFTLVIAERSGNYLFLGPPSVFGGFSESDEDNFDHCRRILEQIEARVARPSDIVEAVGSYSSFCYADRESFQMNTIGATYY